jgi:RIO kinase 1
MDLEKFKIERKVFERRTIFAILKLMNKKILKSVESVVKEGKESVVCAGKSYEDENVAIKIYRTLHCDFKNMWKYLIADPRFRRVRKDRFSIVKSWARREYKNLKRAFENKVNCPKPIIVHENILVMSFIGENFTPAPRLIDVKINNPNKIYKQVVRNMKKLVMARLIHSDLSAFNILLHNNKPYFIDLSQAVTFAHPLALNFLERDCNNINNYFRKLGVEINENLFESLRKIGE